MTTFIAALMLQDYAAYHRRIEIILAAVAHAYSV